MSEVPLYSARRAPRTASLVEDPGSVAERTGATEMVIFFTCYSSPECRFLSWMSYCLPNHSITAPQSSHWPGLRYGTGLDRTATYRCVESVGAMALLPI